MTCTSRTRSLQPSIVPHRRCPRASAFHRTDRDPSRSDRDDVAWSADASVRGDCRNERRCLPPVARLIRLADREERLPDVRRAVPSPKLRLGVLPRGGHPTRRRSLRRGDRRPRARARTWLPPRNRRRCVALPRRRRLWRRNRWLGDRLLVRHRHDRPRPRDRNPVDPRGEPRRRAHAGDPDRRGGHRRLSAASCFLPASGGPPPCRGR